MRMAYGSLFINFVVMVVVAADAAAVVVFIIIQLVTFAHCWCVGYLPLTDQEKIVQVLRENMMTLELKAYAANTNIHKLRFWIQFFTFYRKYETVTSLSLHWRFSGLIGSRIPGINNSHTKFSFKKTSYFYFESMYHSESLNVLHLFARSQGCIFKFISSKWIRLMHARNYYALNGMFTAVLAVNLNISSFSKLLFLQFSSKLYIHN